MVKREVVWSHVEALLERMLDVDTVESDGDAWPIRTARGAYVVRVSDSRHPHVEVYGVALQDLGVTYETLLAINDHNARSSHARWFLDNDRLVIAAELVGASLDYEELACACEEIGFALDEVVPDLAGGIGGTLPYRSLVTDHTDAAPIGVGMYL